MKKTLCLLLILIILTATSNVFAQEKKTEIGWTLDTIGDPYQIGVGDILEIITWKDPRTAVRRDHISAAGLTPMELKFNLEKALKDYVERPVVTVHVTNPMSQKFYVLGEVMRTGEYPLIKHLTVLQAFALAGGFTEWASKDEIILLRHEGGKDKIYRINYKDIARGKDFSQNLKLKADDTIIVP